MHISVFCHKWSFINFGGLQSHKLVEKRILKIMVEIIKIHFRWFKYQLGVHVEVHQFLYLWFHIQSATCYLSTNIEKPVKPTFSRKSFSGGEFVFSSFNAISISNKTFWSTVLTVSGYLPFDLFLRLVAKFTPEYVFILRKKRNAEPTDDTCGGSLHDRAIFALCWDHHGHRSHPAEIRGSYLSGGESRTLGSTLKVFTWHLVILSLGISFHVGRRHGS